MATRSPPPLVSTKHGPINKPTTTISTIIVKAGDEAFLSVGLIQSDNYARLRIDDMRPHILSIGKNQDETNRLINIHQNILNKLAAKEEECEALLARTAALPQEKDEMEAPVYAAMASSLDCTWRELLRRLHLRSNLLRDMNTFYSLLSHHQEIVRVCIGAISALSSSQSPDGLARQIGVSVNEIVEITASAMELGASIMGQLRILGELSDNERREEEIYESMLIVEGAMLKMAEEWTTVEDSWIDEKQTRFEVNNLEMKKDGDDIDRELDEIGIWLNHAGKRLKASTEEGLRTIQAESEEQRSRLIGIISSTSDDRKLERAGELAGGVEELLALVKAALNKGSRIRNFFVSASNTYEQLIGMERDMLTGNESMANELVPLARRKTNSIKEEADSILEKERLTHDERRMITLKKNEILSKFEELEKLAIDKFDSERQLARENLRKGKEWLVREGELWMEKNGDLGGNMPSTQSFIQRHTQFGNTVVERDEAIQFALKESSRLSEEEQRSCIDFQQRYNNLKKNLERRLNLAKTFQQVQEFGRELESSFDSLENLIDQKAEHSDRGIQQMEKVFQMIEETLGQERQQGERFISSSISHEHVDSSMKTKEASETVREILMRHERRFTTMANKWQLWQEKKSSSVQVSRVLEEVQMWQEEVVEIIRLWEEGSTRRSIHDKEEIMNKVEEIERKIRQDNEKIDRMKKTIEDEVTIEKMNRTIQKQMEIEEKMRKVKSDIEIEKEMILQKTKALESEKNEVYRTIEEIQKWQVNTVEIIQLWENYIEERTSKQREEIFNKCNELKKDLRVQNEKIERIKNLVKDEETSSRVLQTVLNQRQIDDRINRIQKDISDEEKEVRIIQEKKTEQEKEIARTIEEIQKWQVDTIEIIRLWETPKEERTSKQREEIFNKCIDLKKDLRIQNEKNERIKSEAKDEETNSRVLQTIINQRQIDDRIDRVQKIMNDEEEEIRIMEDRKKTEQKKEVARTIEEIQKWQVETVEIIRLWETPKEERTSKHREEIFNKSIDLKQNLRVQNEKIEKIKSLVQDDEESSRVLQTIVNQRQIDDKINRIQKDVSDEEERFRIIQEKKKIEEKEEVSRTIDEVQMWQDETVEVIRLWEKVPEERTSKQREEIFNKSLDLKKDLRIQNEKIERVKSQIKDEETSSRVLQTIRNQQEIDDRLNRVQKNLSDEEEKIRIIQDQKKTIEKNEVSRTIDEVQMWQDETVEIIRLWEKVPEERTSKQREEIITKCHDIKEDLHVQNEKIEKIKSQIKDEETNNRILETVINQREIDERINKVKRTLNEEEEKMKVIEDKKKYEIQTAKRIIEEIQQWQEEIFSIIRLWEDKRIEKSYDERIEMEKSIEAIRQDSKVQMDRIDTVKKIIDEKEWITRIDETEKKQIRMNEKLNEMSKKIKEDHIIEEKKKDKKEELIKILEEIEMWQNETIEIIRLWNEKKEDKKKEEITMIVNDMKRKMIQENDKIERSVTLIDDEETSKRVQNIIMKQKEIAAKLKLVEDRLVKEEEMLVVEEVKEEIIKPKIIAPLVDISVEEGKRIEFVAKIHSKPEATIIWLKDGVDIEQSMDYRKAYLNGVATLTIEETFIEDSAIYSLRAKNEGGEVETSAKLTVSSVSRIEDAPRMIRGFKNQSIEEGDKLFLDCVVIAQPEPEVIWFKEERTIKEDERTMLDFKGDHCSLTLTPTKTTDSGMYTAKAKNIHGEATSFCQVKVSPKKIPPPTPPKPERASVSRPPAMQCTLTNETYQEGMKAVLKVLVTGSPRPSIQWFINDKPIQSTERVKITVEEEGWTRLIIDSIREEDSGLYMVVAENEMGEARTGATIHVQPSIKLTRVDKSIEEASGSDKVTILEKSPVPPPIPSHGIKEEITVDESRVETTIHPSSRVMITDKRMIDDTEEYNQKDEETIESLPRKEKEVKTTTTFTTTSTSHIPVLQSIIRKEREDIKQEEIGLSSTSTAPDVIRDLHKEYTFNEGEDLFLEILLVANPRPKVQWFFNDKPLTHHSTFAEISASGDSYSLRIKKAALENAGYYRIRVENVRGISESLCIVHIRPAALGPAPKKQQHITVSEEFAMFEYEQRRPDHLYESRIPTLKSTVNHTPSLGQLEKKRSTEYLEGYDIEEKERVGNPPHFSQTLLSTVTADGSSAKFEGVVTGWPAPEMEWSKDGVVITRNSHPSLTFSNIGGRVSLTFNNTTIADSGKYKCTASNEWGVATSTAQLVVRPRTVAPDFIRRLISEEVAEGETLKWTVHLSGDPLPKVTWLRDGIVVPNCQEVQLIDEGNGIHSMIILQVEMADSGQFTCLAENIAGEARSTADLVVRPSGTEPGHYFHVTKVTQEKQVKGQPIGGRNETFAIESPII